MVKETQIYTCKKITWLSHYAQKLHVTSTTHVGHVTFLKFFTLSDLNFKCDFY